MFRDFLRRSGFCGCGPRRPGMKSCDILWIILLILILFNGGLFGIDICTMLILAIVFGGMILCKGKLGGNARPCGCH